MVNRGNGGSIVMVSSTSSLGAIPDHSVYCSSKGALDQLARCLALELGPHKVGFTHDGRIEKDIHRMNTYQRCVFGYGLRR